MRAAASCQHPGTVINVFMKAMHSATSGMGQATDTATAPG
jgi:hypothetical protein